MMPGDLASAILQNSATPESLAKLRLDLGLDRPAIVRFFDWLFGALHGDFGHSLANGRDVLTEIAPRFANTMFLAAYAAIVAVPLAVGLGVLAAIRQGGCVRPTDQSHHADDDFGAGILPRLSPHQICRRRSRLVSLARQRYAGHGFRRSSLLCVPADVDAGSRHCRAYDADDARLGAFGDGEPLYRNGDFERTDKVAHRRAPRACRMRSRPSSR